MFFPTDIWYFILVIPAMLLGLIASSVVKRTFRKYDGMPSERRITGAQAARRILDQNDLSSVKIELVAGELTDHFDPRTNILRLSQSTFDSISVAAIGVAAHESGHAIQHAKAFLPNKIRGALVPVANIGSAAGPYLAILGIIIGLPILIDIGIGLFGVAVLFYIITLPVEFDASRRAMRILTDTGILHDEELSGARRVLTAAALTYVASLLTALASLARLLLLRGRRSR